MTSDARASLGISAIQIVLYIVALATFIGSAHATSPANYALQGLVGALFFILLIPNLMLLGYSAFVQKAGRENIVAYVLGGVVIVLTIIAILHIPHRSADVPSASGAGI